MGIHIKKLFLTVIICCVAFISKAQLGYNYSQYDFGVGVAANTAYTDAQSSKTTPSFHFNLNFNQTPYVNYILELEMGRLEGGSEYKDTSGRQFSNNFVSVGFRAQVQAGEIIDYSRSEFANAIKNFYLGSGIGFVVNNVSTNRYSYKIPGYYTPGEDHSYEIYIPARVGYEFKMYNDFGEPSVKIDLAWQYNFIMGDDLDGFVAGKSNDSYAEFVLGIKFAIGGETSYRKQISY